MEKKIKKKIWTTPRIILFDQGINSGNLDTAAPEGIKGAIAAVVTVTTGSAASLRCNLYPGDYPINHNTTAPDICGVS